MALIPSLIKTMGVHRLKYRPPVSGSLTEVSQRCRNHKIFRFSTSTVCNIHSFNLMNSTCNSHGHKLNGQRCPCPPNGHGRGTDTDTEFLENGGVDMDTARGQITKLIARAKSWIFANTPSYDFLKSS